MVRFASSAPDVVLAALALLATAVASPARAQQTDPVAPARASAIARAVGPVDSVEVVAVDFVGRARLDADVIEDAIATHATACRSALAAPLCLLGLDFARNERWLDEAEVARDARRIAVAYEINGFPGTTVGHRIERDGAEARVVFAIVEAAPFVVAALTLDGLPRDVPPPASLPLEVGDVYALPALDAAIERVEFQLARHGYPYAAVTVDGAVDESARTAALRLTARPGPLVRFGDARLVAEAPLRADAVRDRLAFRSGGTYDPLALERTERRLYDLEAVGRVVARVEGLRDSATVVTPVIEVSPRALRGLEAEGTLSTTDCFEAAAFWTHRHLGARPRVLRAGVTLANLLADPLGGSFPCTDAGTAEYGRVDYHARLSLEEPIPGTAATWLRAHAFAERQSTPDVFVERSIGVVAALSRQPNDDLGFALEYAPRRFELDAAARYVCGNYGACEPGATNALDGPAWLAPIGASVVWMSDGELQGVTREKLALWRLEPLPRFRAEFRAAVEAAGAWSLSDFDYRRVLAQASATRRVGESIELAGRLRAGALFSDDALPPRVRLFSGGPMSVRGTLQNLLGPASLVADPRDLDALGCGGTPLSCDGQTVDPGRVRLRPLGGDRLVEAGAEARWSFAARAQAAAFVDFGFVSDDAGADDWIVSPGLGLRLIANIGAIRIDLAYDPRGPRDLPLRSAAGVDGEIVDLGSVRFDPFTYDDPGFLREALRRMQLHFAIGQAF